MALSIISRGDRLYLNDGIKEIALYPRDTERFWADDPQFATFLLVFGRDASGKVVELTYGSRWYAGEGYRGPRSFAYPASWSALVGRYENTFFGDAFVTRVVVVKNHLTLDGTDRLKPLANGSFALGNSAVRFDAYAGGQAQRLSIDDLHLYRVELP